GGGRGEIGRRRGQRLDRRGGRQIRRSSGQRLDRRGGGQIRRGGGQRLHRGRSGQVGRRGDGGRGIGGSRERGIQHRRQGRDQRVALRAAEAAQQVVALIRLALRTTIAVDTDLDVVEARLVGRGRQLQRVKRGEHLLRGRIGWRGQRED